MTGLFPFAAPNTDGIIENNKKCFLEFPLEKWENISKEALDLVKKMTCRFQKNRIGIKECLEHKWFTIKITNPKHILTNVINGLNTPIAEYYNADIIN